MINFVSKLGLILGRSFLWLSAVLILLIIILQVSVWFGLQWLNSEKGEEWMKAQIAIALKETDYKIDYNGFHYRPLTNLNVKALTVFDSNGIILSAKNTKLGVNIFPLALRDLSLTVKSDKVTVNSLPKSSAVKVEKPKGFYLQDFSLPNLYFDKFNISNIAINDLEISKQLAGKKINISPSLTGNIQIDEIDEIDFNFTFAPDQRNISNMTVLPNLLSLDGRFNTSTSLFKLNNFLIQSAGYDIKAKGIASLHEEGKIDLDISTVSEDLSNLSSQLDGDFNSEIKISGTQSALMMTAEGLLSSSQLESRGLKPITFNVKSLYQQDKGLQPVTVDISSSYNDIPISLNSLIERQESVILIKNIMGTAPDATITGNVSYDLDTAIATGAIAAAVEKISTYKDLIQLDVSGNVATDIALSQSDMGQQAIIGLTGDNLRYDDIKLNKTKISATFPTVKSFWPTAATWDFQELSAQGARLNRASGSIAIGSDDHYRLNMKGNGDYQKPFSFNANADLEGLQANQPKAKNIDAVINYSKQPLKITGQVDANDIDITLEGTSLSLKTLSDAVPSSLETTQVNVKANIIGKMANPIIASNISLGAFTLSKKTPDIKLDIFAEYKDKVAALNFNGLGTGIETLSGDVKTPMSVSLNPFKFDLPDNQTVTGNAKLNLELENVTKLILPPQYNFSGLVQSNIDIAGTAQTPQIQGTIDLSKSEFTDDDLGVFLKNINMKSQLTNNKFTLNSFTANDNEKGVIKAAGIVDLDAYVPRNIDVKLDMRDFHLLDSDLAGGMFNADLTLSGNPEQYNVTGNIKPDYIDINIPERLTTTIPTLNIVEVEENNPSNNILSAINLDVAFIADNKIFVRGWGLDAEFGGSLKIDGTLNNPNFDGVLKSSRGRISEFGKRFELTRADLNFLGSIPANPIMDIVAETEVNDISAQINLTGRIQDPKITFSSNPYLPEDEVLSRILFGRDLTSISPFQAVQLVQTIRRFSGQGGEGFDPLGTIRNLTGVDDLRIDTDAEGGTTVGAGKYISDKVYLEFEKGSGENSGAANLEVELTPDIKLESQIGQDAQAGAGVFWEWDY